MRFQVMVFFAGMILSAAVSNATPGAVRLNCSSVLASAETPSWSRFLLVRQQTQPLVVVTKISGEQVKGALISDIVGVERSYLKLGQENGVFEEIEYKSIAHVERVYLPLVSGERFRIVHRKSGAVREFENYSKEKFSVVELVNASVDGGRFEVRFKNMYGKEAKTVLSPDEFIQREGVPFIKARMNLKLGDAVRVSLDSGISYQGDFESESTGELVLIVHNNMRYPIDKDRIRYITYKETMTYTGKGLQSYKEDALENSTVDLSTPWALRMIRAAKVAYSYSVAGSSITKTVWEHAGYRTEHEWARNLLKNANNDPNN